MNISEYFAVAAKAENIGSKTFYAVTVVSGALLVLPKPWIEDIFHPTLIVAALIAVVCTIVTRIFQIEGNRLLRASQLSDALGAGLGETVGASYYNSPLPVSILRLASTTLENTLFTTEVLHRMLVKERIRVFIYLCVMLLLLSSRRTSTELLLLLAQTVFSADVILAWIRMERFRYRTNRVHVQLHQFFLQKGTTEEPNAIAIILAASTDYECAKDEASMPLDGAVFDKINPIVSQKWQQMKLQLKIGG